MQKSTYYGAILSRYKEAKERIESIVAGRLRRHVFHIMVCIYVWVKINHSKWQTDNFKKELARKRAINTASVYGGEGDGEEEEDGGPPYIMVANEITGK